MIQTNLFAEEGYAQLLDALERFARRRHARRPQDLEVNNLNSAGWYRADLQKLVAALDGM